MKPRPPRPPALDVLKLALARGGHVETVIFYGFTKPEAQAFQSAVAMLGGGVEHRDLASCRDGYAVPVCFPKPARMDDGG